jgi:hypothetical protein
MTKKGTYLNNIQRGEIFKCGKGKKSERKQKIYVSIGVDFKIRLPFKGD